MKQKLFTFLLVLVVSIGILYASDTQVDGIYYDFDNSTMTATVTYRGSSYASYANEYAGSVIIPTIVLYNDMTYAVTKIEDYSFCGCTTLTSITIPNSVTIIGKNAFEGCSSLTSVTIPNSVTSIGACAFYNCSSLTSVTIPESVTAINYWTFLRCYSLTSITIPNSVISIGSMAFGSSGLISVAIGNSVTSIESDAFSSCSSLESIHWNVKSITGFSISYNSYNGTYSSTNPFYSIRTQIKSFTFGEDVELIPANLCYEMSNISSVIIPNNVTSIGNTAFGSCKSLTSVTIGNSVESIRGSAFEGCSSLTSVTIPSSVTSIENGAFKNCSRLEYVKCNASTPPSIDSYEIFPQHVVATYYDIEYLTCYIPCGALEAYSKSGWNSYMEDFIEQSAFSLTVNSSNNTYGIAKVASRPDCNSAILTAIPNEGCTFVKWSDGNTQSTRYIEVTEDITLTAEFVKKGYTIHVHQDCTSTIE